MKVKDLISLLQKYDGELEVMTKKTEYFGNVGEINSLQNSSYGFFGKSIPCLLLSDEYLDDELNDDDYNDVVYSGAEN